MERDYSGYYVNVGVVENRSDDGGRIQLVVGVKKGAGDRSLFYIVLDKLTCISYHKANKH